MIKSIKPNKTIYRGIIWALFLLSLYILLRLAPVLTKPDYILADDFVQYWSGGKLMLQGENPFDPALIEQMKNQIAGLQPAGGLTSIILTPPWAITMILPFSLFDYPISRLVWLLVTALIILTSTLSLWRMYSGNPKARGLALVAVFIFAPTISALEKGQITVLILLGLSGFLYFTLVARNDWLAGMSLALVSVKPQVVFLFWIILLFWVIQQRRWLIVISTAISILSLTLIAVVINNNILQQYFNMLSTYRIADWANPTIGAYLRFFWLGTDKFWLQFIPSAFGAIWLIYYWYRHGKTWNWLNELPIILFVSIITSSYVWTYDQVILVPAIIQGVIWISSDWKRWSTPVLAVIYLAISILDLFLHRSLNEFWFIWLAPALLILFLVIRWQYPDSRRKLNLTITPAG